MTESIESRCRVGVVLPMAYPELAGGGGPVLERLDPLLQTPIVLSDQEFTDLVSFVRDGLLDPAAKPERLRSLMPPKLPSGRAPLIFQQ